MDQPLFAQNLPSRTSHTILLLTIITVAIEGVLHAEFTGVAVIGYCLFLIILSIAPQISHVETSIFQVFVLIPVFRLVNLSMPVFFEQTLLWVPLIYLPFVPMCLPWWGREYRVGKLQPAFRRIARALPRPAQASAPARRVLYLLARVLGLLLVASAAITVVLILFVAAVYSAEVEHGLTNPPALITSLEFPQFALLIVVMIGAVGFVEELLFRGIIQQELERQLGIVPGVVLTSGIFAVVHSAHAVPAELAYAGGLGLLFGILYDVTGSLSLVSTMHGVLNVFLLGVIPLRGIGASELLRELFRRIIGALFLRGSLLWTAIDGFPPVVAV